MLLFSAKLAEARMVLARALLLYQPAGLLDLAVQMYGRLAIVHTWQRHYTRAVEHDDRAMALLTKLNKHGKLSKTLSNLGGIY